MTLIDVLAQFYAAHSKLGANIAPSDKVVFYEVAMLWNSRRRPATVLTSHAELIERTGLPKSTYHSAMQRLTSVGWLKLQRQGGGIISVELRQRDSHGTAAGRTTKPATNFACAENTTEERRTAYGGSSFDNKVKGDGRDDRHQHNTDGSTPQAAGGSSTANLAAGTETLPRLDENATTGSSAASDAHSPVPELRRHDLWSRLQALDD